MEAAFTAGAVVSLLVLVAIAAVCETVLVHLSVARATTMVDEGRSRADTLVDLLHRREANLGAVLVVRLVAQVGVVGMIVALGRGQDLTTTAWLAVAAALVVLLGVVESLAKTVALVRTDEVALRVSTVLLLIGRVPLLGLLGSALSSFVRHRSDGVDDTERPKVSEEELLAFAEVAVEAEVIETSEHALIESIIEFGDTIVREVMVPRPDMVTVDATWQISDVMEVVILNGYSRIPVTGDGIDDVVGIAYAKDLMRAERDGNGVHPVGDHVRQARFVPEQQRVSSLLPEMQSEQFHMAIVIDEYGGVAGLVTLEDLIEELVGEIVDEFDVEDPMAEPLPGGAYRVNARMPLDEVNDLVDADLPEGDWDTIGGLVFGALGHVPVEGETIDLDTHRLTAARVQGRRIGMVRIDRIRDRDNA
ncbi:MAG: hemolysin family protein [Acidimicrobiales bacterium]|nr:hemolysin family protein [Acidimicrobiales bacterium]